MKKVIYIYVIWSILILGLIILSARFLPLQNNFLGGTIDNYSSNPLVWSHANYDGDHYIEIARRGYGPYQFFYFPLYPLILTLFATVIGDSFIKYVISGTLFSIVATGVALLFIYKLSLLDRKKGKAIIPIVTLLLFPTSFYLQFVYTEGLFLALAAGVFYFSRKGNFWVAAILCSLASATRVIGVALCVSLFVEWYIQKSRKIDLIPVGLSATGLVAYLIYLAKLTGDPFVFVSRVGIFGAQRSSHLISLPQVFYRYVFKILPNLSNYWPITFITLLEFFTALMFLVFLIFSFRKIRFSYWVYMCIGYIVPTLSGSFSSMPRYILVLFPFFIVTSAYIERFRTWQKVSYYAVSFLFLSVLTMMFVRGYWVS